MFDPHALLLFVIAGLVLNFTPGPDLLYITARSLGQGWRAGAASSLGIAAGCLVHTAAAALGISVLLAASPLAYDAVRLAGAAYLVFLGVQALRRRAAPGTVAELPPDSPRRVFWQGFTTNVLNPKVALFVLAFLPPFIDPQAGSIVVQMLVLASIINAAGLVVNGAVIVMAGELGRFLARNRAALNLQKWFLGAVFAGLGLKLLLDARR
jgi:threonine/homoserine/homoserine lactone efflux protein